MGNIFKEPGGSEGDRYRDTALFTFETPDGSVTIPALEFFGHIFHPQPVDGELPHPEIQIKPYMPEELAA